MYRTHFLSNDLDKVAYYKNTHTLNKLKWTCKSSYYKQQFELNKNNLKNKWKLIGTIINRKPKGHTVPAKLPYNGQTYTNKHDIVNQFNEYFINIGRNLASTAHSSIKPDDFLPATHSSSFFLSPVDSAQVVELALSGLDRHKATIDIPNYLIKIAPDIFKISKVTPVFKTGTVTDPGNYRPIAVLSPFAKILERLVYNQLSHFLEKENILFKHQFGFRKNYSTEQAILELTDNLKMKIDSNEAICSIFLDLSKAFDTVNHQILLQKLYRYGIRGVPLQWFKSYHEGRTQYVEVEPNVVYSKVLPLAHFRFWYTSMTCPIV